MRKITFSVEEQLIEQARLVARSRNNTLNDAFREWLERYVAQFRAGTNVEALRSRLKHVSSAGPYTREEMNKR
jgi:hypothetical protein